MARPRVVRPKEALERATDRELEDLDDEPLPEDCDAGERPCPFVRCKHHLYLDVNPETGALKLNFPHLGVDELPETCAIDVARRGGHGLEEIGKVMNLTRERVRQIELRALLKLPTRTLQMIGVDDPSEI